MVYVHQESHESGGAHPQQGYLATEYKETSIIRTYVILGR